ncbi:hypothetical protein [Streptomyces antibioticus]|uniref:Uncharacterized protein n=1 Tax=Streptomyces antibioticus TaxID=1890 RepID=A0AAE7CND5_STRAT|nr:hypothetical protein [Streptomyces antibioticus]OOQ47310.1 hypothetical protein AFM16_31720 [Streptomyces antibioticus]QIT47631.1 hypothetical protein HCX60_32270 [Streptomyces antibioticus]
MTWATTSDVITYTGINATAAQVEQAQGVIELFADVTEQASDDGLISEKNLRLLKQAVAYQAAWITQHPDAFTNVDLTSFNQDQVSGQLRHDNALILAPLAKRCIDRLSWRRNRGLRIQRRGGSGSIPARMNLTSAVADDNDPRWRPIGEVC